MSELGQLFQVNFLPKKFTFSSKYFHKGSIRKYLTVRIIIYSFIVISYLNVLISTITA